MHIHVHACAHVAVPPPSAPLTLLDLQRLFLPSTLIKNRSGRFYTKKKKIPPPKSCFLLKASLLHSPWDSQEWHSFPAQKGKVAFPNADGNPVTMRTGWWEQLGSRSSIPLPHFHTQPSSPSANPPCSLSSSHYPVQRKPRFFKPRSSPWAVHSTAYQATGPADNQALYTVHVLSHF